MQETLKDLAGDFTLESIKRLDKLLEGGDTVNEKALEIIFKKSVDIRDITMSKDYDEYVRECQFYCDEGLMLPENVLEKEEFDLLKEAGDQWK